MTGIPNVLSIAGSDPSGGAGIQADLKTFAAHGCYGMAAMTALTAQNTRAVTGIELVPPAFVASQIDAVFADVRVDAVKIGMLASAEIIGAVADALERHRPANVVLDPVMVSKSGARLLQEDAVTALRDRLLPLAGLVTPNLPEAADLLAETEAESRDAMPALARRLAALGPRAVLLKGGHLAAGESPDYLVTPEGGRWLEGARIATRNTHGTGCTLSSAIAARLARGHGMAEAVHGAKAYLTDAIAAADMLEVGGGSGPVHHAFTTVRRWPSDLGPFPA
jgi:hydroxymethylpyrimidine/phosphomethylpyrimidine kinase